VHGEIFDVGWWQAIQRRLQAGEFNDVPPYPETVRLRFDARG
jgi:isocitrate dehydrogenase kinase/phosphatase